MKLTIEKKLIGSFFIVALLLGITSGISLYYLNKIEESTKDLIEVRAVILSNLQKIQVDASKESSRLNGYLLTKDTKFLNDLQNSYETVDQLLEETASLAYIPEFQAKLQELDRLNEQFKQKYDQLITMVQTNRESPEVMNYFASEVLPAGQLLDSKVEELANYQLNNLMIEESQKNTEMVESVILNVFILSILAIVIAIVIGYFTSRSIAKPIIAIDQAAARIALGDLTADSIKVKNRDEIGGLAQSFNTMAENLRELVRQISSSSEHVAMSSEELTASAGQSSQASEAITMTIQEVTSNVQRQAQSVNESAAAIIEMSSGIQQIASSAQTTSSLSVQASQKSLEGNQAIQLSVKQMDSIQQTMSHLSKSVTEMEEHSKEIEHIVEIISEIAAQTNLLALNAAIEAARAGEQGRGFAVVADEVRKLAEQSNESAGDIAKLVNTIKTHTHHVIESMEVGVKEVDEGIQVVHQAGQLFKEIKSNIDEVSGQVQEISAASEQISASTEQVVASVEEISRVSKRVATETETVSASAEEQLASVEEITSSAISLSKMAEELQKLVGVFKV